MYFKTFTTEIRTLKRKDQLYLFSVPGGLAAVVAIPMKFLNFCEASALPCHRGLHLHAFLQFRMRLKMLPYLRGERFFVKKTII